MIHPEEEEEASTDYGREKTVCHLFIRQARFYILGFVLSVHPRKKMWAFFYGLKCKYV